MADLPADRIIHHEPPFTSVGVDCFRRGRALIKRYGVIFTCLAIRAVHLEIAYSLDTDSFLMTLRRFIARRGQVKEIRSDNATNFTGGEREIKESSINSWNCSKIHRVFCRKASNGSSILLRLSFRRRVGTLYTHHMENSQSASRHPNYR